MVDRRSRSPTTTSCAATWRTRASGAPGVVWDPLSIAAVEGHPNHVNSIVFDTVYWTSLATPDDGCPGVPAEDNYNAQTNPGGVRCTLADYMINVMGPRPSSLWGAAEQQSATASPACRSTTSASNTGSRRSRPGAITTDQFVDLNDKIGGADIDINHTPERSAADEPALARAYRSGAVNSTNNLDRVAIIDLRGPDPGAFHDAYRSLAIRARLEREHGTYANQVIWFGAVPLMGDVDYADRGPARDGPLAGRGRGRQRTGTLAQKIIRDRPPTSTTAARSRRRRAGLPARASARSASSKEVQTRFGTPRTVAGEGIDDGHNKCQLKPLRRSDYYPIAFTDGAVGEAAGGVPDRRLRLEQAGSQPVRHGPVADLSERVRRRDLRRPGARSGAAGSGGGWTSDAFESWRY